MTDVHNDNPIWTNWTEQNNLIHSEKANDLSSCVRMAASWAVFCSENSTLTRETGQPKAWSPRPQASPETLNKGKTRIGYEQEVTVRTLTTRSPGNILHLARSQAWLHKFSHWILTVSLQGKTFCIPTLRVKKFSQGAVDWLRQAPTAGKWWAELGLAGIRPDPVLLSSLPHPRFLRQAGKGQRTKKGPHQERKC